MRITRLRRRPHDDEEVHDPLVKDLLEVLLCGLGAAAALMILYSVLPKSGAFSATPGAVPERSATRTELRARRHRDGPPGQWMIQIWVKAPAGSKLEPNNIRLLDSGGMPLTQWVEGREQDGWRSMYFLWRPPDKLADLELYCLPAPAQDSNNLNLDVEVWVDVENYHFAARYDPPPPPMKNNLVSFVGTFKLSAAASGPPPVAAARVSNLPKGGIPIATIHPADAEIPITGTLDQ